MPSLRSLKVTLIRHGESQDNQDGIWAGFKDSPLTPLGLAQAKALGKWFSNVPLVGIYCSDLKRAASTANEILVANTTEPPPLLVQSQSLREQNFGVAEGKSWADKDALQMAQASTGEDAREFRFQGGETLEEVNRRMATSVRRFVLPRVEALRQESSKSISNPNEAANQPHICIVAHGIAIAELLRVFMSLHDSNYSDVSTSDASLSSSHNAQSWPWEHPSVNYTRVRLENTGFTELEIAVPISNPGETTLNSGLGPIYHPPSRSTSPVPSTSPLPSKPPRSAEESSQEEANNIDLSQTSQSRAAPPLALQSASSNSSSKSLFVRILSQNNIEHLRGVVVPSSGKLGKGKASAVAASILGGGSGGASSSGLPSSITSNSLSSNGSGSANLPLPQTPSTGASGGFPSRSPGAQSSFATSPASTTPSAATAKSIGAYDARLMAKEMERGGQGGMLAGGFPQIASPGSSVGGAPHGADLSTPSSTPGLGLGLGIASSNTANGYNSNFNTNSNSNSNANQTLATYQMPSSASALYHAFSGSGNPNLSSAALGGGKVSFSTEEREVWHSVLVRTLPLFNGEGLQSHLEDINESVSQHVAATVKRTPGRALDALSADLSNLVQAGMLTLTTKLADSVSAVQVQAQAQTSRSSVELEAKTDERLLTRLVELWTMFFSSVLPYLEGCVLPFQTNPDLVSLTSSAKAANAARSTVSTAGLRTEKIDTRKVILTQFRDAMILPIFDRLFYLFANIRQFQPDTINEHNSDIYRAQRNGSTSSFSAAISTSNPVADDSAQLSPRLLQMTSVLSSILSNDQAQHAVDALLRALRVGNSAGSEPMGKGDRSKASGGNDLRQQSNKNRHGWLPKSAVKHGKGATSTSGSTSSLLNPIPSPRMNSNNLPSQSQSTLVNPSTTVGDERSQYASYSEDMAGSTGTSTIGRGGTLASEPLASLRREFSAGSSRDPSSYSNSSTPFGILRAPTMTEDDYLTSLRSPVHSPGHSATSADSPSPAPDVPLDQAVTKDSNSRAPFFDTSGTSSLPTFSQVADDDFRGTFLATRLPRSESHLKVATTATGYEEDGELDFTPTTSSVSAFSPSPQASINPTNSVSTNVGNKVSSPSSTASFISSPVRPPRRQSPSPSSPAASSKRSPLPPPKSPNRHAFGNVNSDLNQNSPFAHSTAINLSPVSIQSHSSPTSEINSSNSQSHHPLSKVTQRGSDFASSSPDLAPSQSTSHSDPLDVSSEQDKERARALALGLSFEGGWDEVQEALENT